MQPVDSCEWMWILSVEPNINRYHECGSWYLVYTCKYLIYLFVLFVCFIHIKCVSTFRFAM